MAALKKATRRKKAATTKKATAQSARERKAGDARPARRKTGGRGKPKIEFDIGSLRRLAEKGNTNETIAVILGVSEATLQARIADTPEVSQAIKLGNAKLDHGLRTWQVSSAKKGNATMQIWLGKQRLGQRDVRSLELTGTQGGPVSFMAELTPVLEQKLVDFLRNRQAAEIER